MPFAFTMPKLSPTMEEGTIDKWHKKEGDFVKAGEVLLEIATDKAVIEHQALDEGWLRKILVPEAKIARVNQAIAIFTEEESESIEGFQVEEGLKEEEPAEAETLEEKKPIQGTQSKEIEKKGPLLEEASFTPEPPLADYEFSENASDKIIASPLAKRIAKEKELDLSTVKGSGPGGRITSHDLELAQPKKFLGFQKTQKPRIPPGSYEEIPLSPMRKTVAKRLQKSKSFIPHFYLKQTINASPIFDLREQLKNLDLKVTFNDMILKASALALKAHPEMNAGFNSVNQTIIRFKTIDISVAVVIDAGLITPIVRLADTKNLGEISIEMKDLTQRAKLHKLRETEYKGGSFCLSNLGMYKITEFTAVINPPQAAILAIGGIEDNPVIKNGQIVIGKTMNLVLSSDHRVIDGALAAKFIKTVQHFLENPASLLLN